MRPFEAAAQDFLSLFQPSSVNTRLDLDSFFVPNQDYSGSDQKTQLLSTQGVLNQKLYEGNSSNVSMGAKLQKLDLSATEGSLSNYYNIQGSLGYQKKLSDDKFWFLSLAYGSASDRPFKSWRDEAFSGNFIYKFDSKWFGVVNYSNNRTFLNNIPLPGLFYVKEMNREKALVLGFPFVYWMTPVGKNWSFRYFGLIPWTHRTRVLYTKWKMFSPYIGYEQNPQSYFRYNRDNPRDRFFWFERRIGLGLEGGLSGSIRYDLSAGLAFDREFFEARNFAESKNYVIRVDNGYYAALSMKFSF